MTRAGYWFTSFLQAVRVVSSCQLMPSQLFSDLTHNVITRMIAGKKHDGELGVAKQFKEIVRENFELSGATNIGDFVPATKWIGLNNLEKRLAVLHRKGDEFVQDLIPTHRKVKESASDQESSETMIDVLLTLQETEPEYYTDGIIRGLMTVMLSATARTMGCALSLLQNNPQALMKAQIEIDTSIGSSKLIEESDLPKLPYL
ncbi:hypothetical protein SADUNF_Sadunf02G0102100 [Salix dunnii]|uniref:Uncharacterized protein n=1 Tax=Salix dunnii TaxID=1413687 RepID=A0A835N7D6_9ROSI|nr:hypothetical protein SADUNF_Sadunf02G0102100 [Salix dunnii]